MTQPATHRLCILRSFRLIILQEPSQTYRSEDPYLFPLYPIVQLSPKSSQSVASIISDLVLQASLTSKVPSKHGRPAQGQLRGQSIITPIVKSGKDTDEEGAKVCYCGSIVSNTFAIEADRIAEDTLVDPLQATRGVASRIHRPPLICRKTREPLSSSCRRRQTFRQRASQHLSIDHDLSRYPRSAVRSRDTEIKPENMLIGSQSRVEGFILDESRVRSDFLGSPSEQSHSSTMRQFGRTGIQEHPFIRPRPIGELRTRQLWSRDQSTNMYDLAGQDERAGIVRTTLPGEMTRGIQLAPLRNLDGLSDELFAENRLPALTLAVLRNTRYDTPLRALSGTGVGVGLTSLATTDFSFLDPGVHKPVKARSGSITFLTNDTDLSILCNQASTVQNPDARCPTNIHKMRIDHLVS